MSMRRCEIEQQARFLSEEQIIEAITGRRSIKYYAYILHDKDEYTEVDEQKNPEHKAGTLKEPHWHVVLVFFDGQQQQLKYIAAWFKQPTNRVEKIKSLEGTEEAAIFTKDSNYEELWFTSRWGY